MKYLLPTFLFLSSWNLNAQRAEIDSVKFLLTETSPDSIRIDLYLELSRLYDYLNRDTSLFYAKSANELAAKNGYRNREAQSLNVMSMSYERIGEVEEGIVLLERAKVIAEEVKDTSLMGSINNNIGLSLMALEQTEEALVLFQEAYDWAKKIDDRDLYERVVNSLGIINSEIERYDEAIKFFEETRTFAIAANSIEGEAVGGLNIAITYMEMKEYDKALIEYNKILSLVENEDNFHLQAFTYGSLSDCYLKLKKTDLSLKTINESIEIALKYEYKDLEVFGLAQKADILVGRGDFDEAKRIARSLLEEIKGSDFESESLELKETLAKAYYGSGDYQEAFLWQEKHVNEKDSIYRINRDKEIAELEIRFHSSQKEAENNLLKHEKEVHLATLKQRTWIAVSSFLGLMLFGIVAFQLFLTRRKLKSINFVLEEKVKERTESLEEKNEELHLSNEELKRFAFIASHDLKEPLRSMGGFISLIRKKVDQKDFESIDEYMAFIEKSNYQMVNLVDNILEYSKLESKKSKEIQILDIKEEVADICELMTELIRGSGTQISFKNLPNIVYNRFVLRTILKNVLENGIKYNTSETPIIDISYQIGEDTFDLIVTDNGIGIAKEYQQQIFEMFVRLHNRSDYDGSGMGLAFCKKLLNGPHENISVDSEPGKGSTFKISLNAKVIYGDGGTDFVQNTEEQITTS